MGELISKIVVGVAVLPIAVCLVGWWVECLKAAWKYLKQEVGP